MKLISNYEGSSIEFISYDEKTNSVQLSLRLENDDFNPYYNFIVDNKNGDLAKVFINNIDFSKYYNKNYIYLPYKKVYKTWERISTEDLSAKNDTLGITIHPNEVAEISLIPRYTRQDLTNFVKTIMEYDFINIKHDILTKIEIGDKNRPSIFVIGRQQPGETLASFFIEGMINSIIKNNLYKKYHYVFFPIVNTLGVQTGCYHYIDGIDFNKSWNLGAPPREIGQIIKTLELYKPKYFIDVHNNEIIPTNRIKAEGNLPKDTFTNFELLKPMSSLRRLIENIIDLHEQTAIEYVKEEYDCTSILIDLSMKNDYKECEEIGYQFISEL